MNEQLANLIAEGLKTASNTIGGSKAGSLPSPKTDDELHAAVAKYFNVKIPRNKVCKDHAPPFTAFANAYFGRDTVSVWKASRGFGGKSMLLALLGLSESVFLGAKCNILGGSGEQSERVLNYINGEEMPTAFWNAPDAPKHLIVGGIQSEVAENARGITKRMIKLTNGGYLKALMASSRSVRGPHPQRLRLDEIDEMEMGIFESALGQPMERFGIKDQTVASSTHHYANGTMTAVLKMASEKGWGFYEWCYKENLEVNGGWLTQESVDRKKNTVTVFMWDTEYEGQEPNPTGRAIDPEKVKLAFREDLGIFKGDEHELIEIEAPYKGGDPETRCHRCKHPYFGRDLLRTVCINCHIDRRLTRPGIYAHGADWAKKKDWCVFCTFRIDVYPAKCVSWQRTGRLDWPSMVSFFETRVKRYGGGASHDITGIGDVIADYLTCASEGVLMTGLPRHEMLSHYIAAIEHGKIVYPMIKWAWDNHRLASVEDVFKSGDKHHLPDDMAAGALAWKAGGLGNAGEIYVPMLDGAGNLVLQGTKERP